MNVVIKLPLLEHTDAKAWIVILDRFEALGADVVMPLHGGTTDMTTVRKYHRDYAAYLRDKVAEVIEKGVAMQEANQIDQLPYMHLPTAEFLSKRNTGQMFQSMEF